MELPNRTKYANLYWYKVKMRLLEDISKNEKTCFKEYYRFYVWRDPESASTCEIQKILDNQELISCETFKEVIIVIVPSRLSDSFQVGETLQWGGLNRPLGTLLITSRIEP